jgi:hypothetical protein
MERGSGFFISEDSGRDKMRIAMREISMTERKTADDTTGAPPAPKPRDARLDLLRGVVDDLVTQLKGGSGDRDRRRQVEEWLRTLADKYPEFAIETGLRDYYVAEATRLRQDFDEASELAEKLTLGRQVEGFLDRAAEYERRLASR